MGSMTHRPQIYVLDPYHESAIGKLKACNDIDLVLPNDPMRSEFLDHATAVLVRSETKLTAEVIRDAHPGLKYIVKQGVGVDNIDLEAASIKGIKVFNTPGLNSEAVAELTLSLAFCVARRVCEIDRMIRDGKKVVRSQLLGKSLFRKALGVVGMGNIGLEVAKKWIGCTGGLVFAFDPFAAANAWIGDVQADAYRRVHDLEELLRASDVVTLHVPLTSGTKDMLSKEQFAVMKEGSILLNCARGGIVDEAALLQALESGRLFGAGLDAVLHEPPTLKDYHALLEHPRVVLSPHVGASTEENQQKSGMAAVQIVLDLLNEKSLSNLPKAVN